MAEAPYARCPCFPMLDYSGHTPISNLERVDVDFRLRGSVTSSLQFFGDGSLGADNWFMYFWLSSVTGCEGLYSETTDSDILTYLSCLIQCKEENNFMAEKASIFTWVDESGTCDGPVNKFQVVFVTKAEETFLLVNFQELNTVGEFKEAPGGLNQERLWVHPFDNDRAKFINQAHCCPGNFMFDVGTNATNRFQAFGPIDNYPGAAGCIGDRESCVLITGPTGCYVCKDKKCNLEEFVTLGDEQNCDNGCEHRCMTVFKNGNSKRMIKTLSDSCRCTESGAREPGECAKDCGKQGIYRGDCVECSEPVFEDEPQ